MVNEAYETIKKFPRKIRMYFESEVSEDINKGMQREEDSISLYQKHLRKIKELTRGNQTLHKSVVECLNEMIKLGKW